MSQQTKKIDSILNNDDSVFGRLINKAKTLSKLDDIIQRVLDEKLKGRYKIAGYEKGVLTFLTDNSATATQIRYQTPEILKRLRSQSQWAGLVTINVKVHHHWHEYIARFTHGALESIKAAPKDPYPQSKACEGKDSRA